MKPNTIDEVRTAPAHLQDGAWAEDMACKHLADNGLLLLEKNWRCRYGELDLIMYDGDILVFVEVRYRRQSHGITALESIGPNKCRRLINTALSYLGSRAEAEPPSCRFDVVTLSGVRPQVTTCWTKNAFFMP